LGKHGAHGFLAAFRGISKHFSQLGGYKGRMLIHALGLSAIGASLFLEVMVFGQIFGQGYFLGVEGNSMVLFIEVGFVGVAILYYCYLFVRLLSRDKQ
jgi:hypothetical protein